MTSEVPPASGPLTHRVEPISIAHEMKTSYINYAMSVIIGRAIPDVRDGLKPVHRRSLFAMWEMGNTSDKPTKKSARVVGEVMGKFHPHGDASIYDTIVKMAQPFSYRNMLVQGQGKSNVPCAAPSKRGRCNGCQCSSTGRAPVPCLGRCRACIAQRGSFAP